MSTINQSGWRPTTPEAGEASDISTFTGNRALMLEEALIFEIGSSETTGVDFDSVPIGKPRFGDLYRDSEIGLPGLSEPETVRHYTRLSRQNYAIDLGLFPLGSCTMKHNPRLNERMAQLPGFADIHPLAPVDTVQGALEVIDQLAHWLITLTGMQAVAIAPRPARMASFAASSRSARRSTRRASRTARSCSSRPARTAPTRPLRRSPASRSRTSPPPRMAASTSRRSRRASARTSPA
jgi:hypothetical protein